MSVFAQIFFGQMQQKSIIHLSSPTVKAGLIKHLREYACWYGCMIKSSIKSSSELVML